MRVWLICGVVTAIVVAGTSFLVNRRGAGPEGSRPRKPPAPLTEQEIRTYLDVQPEITEQLGRIAMEYQKERALQGGKVDEAAIRIRSQALIDSILERYHLTRETWYRLSERVEYAVNAVRAGPDLEAARPDIEAKLELKRAVLPKLAVESERAAVEKEIRDLEGLLRGEGPPLLQSDRALIRQYWSALDSAALRRGPPKRPEPGSGDQGGK